MGFSANDPIERRWVLGKIADVMNTFQVIFQSGRVQNILADKWRNRSGTIRFEVDGREAAAFPARDLLMVDQLDGDEGYAPRLNRHKINVETP